jgi:hypothetical protein
MKNSHPMLVCAFLFVGIPLAARAQDQSTAPAKKVWTNDDVEALRSSAGVSTAGGTANSAAKTTKTNDAPVKPADGKDAKWYRAQIRSLNDKIPPIDAEIDQMHRFQDGSYQSPGGIPQRPYFQAPLNPADRIVQLEKQKQAILDRIDVLQDEARHAGVLPGDLR